MAARRAAQCREAASSELIQHFRRLLLQDDIVGSYDCINAALLAAVPPRRNHPIVAAEQHFPAVVQRVGIAGVENLTLRPAGALGGAGEIEDGVQLEEEMGLLDFTGGGEQLGGAA